MPPQRRAATEFQRNLAARLDVTLPADCNSHDAARALDRAISRETKRVREVNPALQVGKVVMYKDAAWEIRRLVDKFKFAIRPFSGGKTLFVWIIDLEHCEEVPVEG